MSAINPAGQATATGPGTEAVSATKWTKDTATGPSVPDFEVREKLGQGGMGVVYRAWQQSLKRSVALKVIRGAAHAGPEELARFRVEGEAVARLHHPNILQVHATGEHAGCPYVALELVDGPSLDRYLGGAPQAACPAAELVRALAEAVHHAHARGVIHRDLKPANVLLDPLVAGEGPDVGSAPAPGLERYRPKIADFGLAKLRGDERGQTATGAVLGTPSYMAPEQAGGPTREIGPATDVYALGAILYELLTGRPPFRGATALDTIQMLLSQEPLPPSQLQPKVPRDLETVCLKCLRKEANKRYASAAELAEDLGRFLRNEPIHARPTPVLVRAWKWARRRPAAAVSLVLLAGLLVGSVALGYRERVHGQQLRQQKDAADKQRHRADQAWTASRRSLYLSQIKLAHQAWQKGELGALAQLLGRQAGQEGGEDLRGFEWYYLFDLSMSRRGLFVIDAQQGMIDAAAFSPTEDVLATAGKNGPVKLWDVTSGRLLRALPRGAATRALAYSPDGRQLALADRDGSIRLWDVAASRVARTLTGHKGEALAVAFAPDGKSLASTGEDLTVRLWEAQSGKARVLQGSIVAETSVAFSPDGTTLATGNRGGVVRILDVASGRPRQSWRTGFEAATPVRYAPNGKLLAVGSSRGTVSLWSPATGDKRGVLPAHAQMIWDIAFSPDGSSLATASADSTVKLWELSALREERTLRGHSAGAGAVAFSRDGRRLASGGIDQSVIVWDRFQDQEFDELRGPMEDVLALAFTPAGDRLITAGGRTFDRKRPGEIGIWDVSTKKIHSVLQHGPPSQVQSLAFSADSRLLAVARGDAQPVGQPGWVQVWDTTTRQEIAQLRGHRQPVWWVAFSPDRNVLASAAADGNAYDRPGEVKIWELPSGRELASIQSEKGGFFDVAFAPGGGPLAIACLDGGVHLWAASGDKPLADPLRGPPGVPGCLAFSPDGRTLAVSYLDFAAMSAPADVRLWDIATRKEKLRLTGRMASVLRLAFAPDGRTLATASFDGLVKLWDVTTGSERTSLKAHAGPALALAFSPDGKLLATGANLLIKPEGEMKLWDVETGKQRNDFTGLTGPMQAVAFSPDGKQLAAANQLGALKLWDLPSLREQPDLQGPASATRDGHSEAVVALAVSPNGELLVTAGADEQVKLWDLASGRVLGSLPGRTGPVVCLAFSPDGSTLATGSGPRFPQSRPGRVLLWDVQSRKQKAAWPELPGGVSCLAFSPDGRTLAWAAGESVSPPGQSGRSRTTIRLTDTITGETRPTLVGAEAAWVFALALVPAVERWRVPWGARTCAFGT